MFVSEPIQIDKTAGERHLGDCRLTTALGYAATVLASGTPKVSIRDAANFLVRAGTPFSQKGPAPGRRTRRQGSLAIQPDIDKLAGPGD